jgi:hypothetical protein
MQANQSLPFAASSSPTGLGSNRREERRLQVVVPVKVFPDTASFESLACCTYEVSTLGARLAALPALKEVGQVIFLQRQNRRAKYRVTWIGAPDTSQAGQVGVENLEPGNMIWENEIKSRISWNR